MINTLKTFIKRNFIIRLIIYSMALLPPLLVYLITKDMYMFWIIFLFDLLIKLLIVYKSNP